MNFNLVFNEAKIIEPPNFVMDRTSGSARFYFFHFSSQIEIEINGEKCLANPGAIILFTPNTPQIFTPKNGRLVHDYVDFELIDQDFLEDIHFPLNVLLYPRISNTITSTILKLKEISNKNDLGSRYEADILFSSLLLNISKKLYKKRHNYTTETNEKIIEKLETARLNLYQEPENKNVSSLAREIGFSPVYLNKIYKNTFSISPMKDITLARIEYAKSSILQGQNPSSISNYLGFANAEYFYNWFKSKTGFTPKEYVQQNKNK